MVAARRSGCKPRDRWRIGTEHEKLGFNRRTLRRLSYDEISKAGSPHSHLRSRMALEGGPAACPTPSFPSLNSHSHSHFHLQLLRGLESKYGWEPILEGDKIIGVVHEGKSVTLEPGGQVSETPYLPPSLSLSPANNQCPLSLLLTTNALPLSC